MPTYSFRAECMHDIKELQRQFAESGIAVSMCVKPPGVFNMPEPPSDPEVEMESDASLESVRDVMRRIEDGHVMIQTLRSCALSDNTLDRDYDLH